MAFSSGFQSLRNEIAVEELSIEGHLPDWIEGTLIRNGPAQFEVGEDTYNHWFDGLAMLHAFQIEDGKVGYRNRFLESNARREALKKGRISRAEFGTDPCRSIFGRVMSLFRPRLTDNASINVAKVAGQWVAMTETPLPVAFEPKTLETVGVVEFADDVDAQVTTAHPHVHPDTGRTTTYMATFGRQCQYHIVTVDPGSRRREVRATLFVDRPSYMHSFAVTERYAVLSEWPLRVNPLDLLLEGKPFIENYNWVPEEGTRFRVVRLSDGEEVTRISAPAAFAFHHVNAFEQGDSVICDVVTYDDASIIDALYLDRLQSDQPTPAVGRLQRYRLPLAGTTKSVSPTPISDTLLELPRVHDRAVEGRTYRYVYGVGAYDIGNFTDQLVKIDVETGAAETWRAPDTYPGEPVFVPAPNGRAEDYGVVLSVVFQPEENRSFLLVLDAHTFTEVARVPVPHAIPFGFHGQFI